jgi:hypothetical protein
VRYLCALIREDGEGRTKILLPVGFIREQEIPQEKPPKPVPRLRTKVNTSSCKPSTSDESTDDSTDESEVEYVLRPNESESTLTENSDGTAHDISILSGDAHPEDIQGEEMEIGSASDTAEVEDETPQDTESKTPVPVPVRRSARERRQPALLNSGQYNVSKSATCIKQTSLQQQIPEWQQIADLSHLYVKHNFLQA